MPSRRTTLYLRRPFFAHLKNRRNNYTFCPYYRRHHNDIARLLWCVLVPACLYGLAAVNVTDLELGRNAGKRQLLSLERNREEELEKGRKEHHEETTIPRHPAVCYFDPATPRLEAGNALARNSIINCLPAMCVDAMTSNDAPVSSDKENYWRNVRRTTSRTLPLGIQKSPAAMADAADGSYGTVPRRNFSGSSDTPLRRFTAIAMVVTGRYQRRTGTDHQGYVCMGRPGTGCLAGWKLCCWGDTRRPVQTQFLYARGKTVQTPGAFLDGRM